MVLTLIACSPMFYQVGKAFINEQEDKTSLSANLRSVTHLQMPHDFQKFSCLIAGVYARDHQAGPAGGPANGLQDPPKTFFNAAGYSEVVNSADLPEYDELQRGTTWSSLLRAFDNKKVKELTVLFKSKYKITKKDAVHNTEGESYMYVVAVRGTILSRLPDLRDDSKIVLETLHKREENYLPIVDLIDELVRSGCSVAIVGHSLGASLALLAARRLVLDHGTPVECHLFNLPNFSLDVALKKLFIGEVKGFSDAIGLVSSRARVWTREFGEGVARAASDLVSSVLPDNLRAGEEAALLDRSRFCPQIYFNFKDPVSNEFNKLFEEAHPRTVQSTASRLTGGLLDSKSFQFVPRGVLHKSTCGKGPTLAHSLMQWFMFVNRTGQATVEVQPFSFNGGLP